MSSGEPAPEPDEHGNIKAERVIGEVLANRYQIEMWLGEGAMGTVYKAKHVKVGRAFAVKILHKRTFEDRKLLQRFEREAELAGRLRHPNVVGVVDVGETHDGYKYMVMDFAEGDDLATLLQEAPMPAERIVHLTRQILEGLYHAHEQGLIHRDFKPENVIIERDDHGSEVPRIVDFGIAILREGGDSASSTGRLTTNGLVLGTPHYMAPEQAIADPIDHRIDLFALGIVIYELLCGKLPFDGTGAEVARANLLLDPPPIAARVPYLEVDPLLEAFSRRLMSKKREHRPATAKAARELLDLIVKDREAAATALGVPLEASSRQPAITQPVTPQAAHGDGESSERRRASDLEAPPVRLPAAVAAATGSSSSSASAQREIRTDLAAPLSWGGRRRRTWIIAAIGALGAGAIATVITLKTDRTTDPQVGAAAPVETIPATSPPGNATTPPPAPPAPANDPAPTTEAAPATDPTATGSNPARIDAVAPTTEPPARPPVKRPVRPGKKPVVATRPEPTKLEPTKPEPTKPEPTKPEPTKPAALDAGAVYALFAAVGSELAQARQVRGAAAVATIEQQYRRIQIQDGTSTQPKRDATAAMLTRLRAQLAPLKQQP